MEPDVGFVAGIGQVFAGIRRAPSAAETQDFVRGCFRTANMAEKGW
jgi:hypothetical protein